MRSAQPRSSFRSCSLLATALVGFTTIGCVEDPELSTAAGETDNDVSIGDDPDEGCAIGACEPADDRIDSEDEADEFFVNQWGPTAWTSGQAPFGYSDCMPTSGLIVLGALGLYAHPGPGEVFRAIDDVRDRSAGYDTTYSIAMDFSWLSRGMDRLGAEGIWHGTSVDAIDAALERGSFVVASGGPWAAWGQWLAQHGQYLNVSDPGPHAVAILGRRPDGLYLVADPLSTIGTIGVSRQQVTSFVSRDLPGIVEYRRK